MSCSKRLAFLLVLALAGQPALAWDQAESYRFEGVNRVVAVGDIHGALAEFRSLLIKTALIDGDDNWSGGQSHLVSVGDFLDRGDDSRAVMDLLIKLQTQAAVAGGKVHVLLGNHEVMNLSGELDYVTDGEFASYADFEPANASAVGDYPTGYVGHRLALSPAGHYGRWLMDRPFVIVIDGVAFLHGGLSDDVRGLGLDAINRQAREQLKQFVSARAQLLAAGVIEDDWSFSSVQKKAEAASMDGKLDDTIRQQASILHQAGLGLPFNANGPLWYRRSALCHPYYEQSVVENTLKGLSAERLVIGHTPTAGRTVQSRMDGRVLLVDTGMNVGHYAGHPSALVIANGELEVIYSDLDDNHVQAQTNRMWQRPYDLSDVEIERLMTEGEIIKVEDLATGVTKPRRLTLRLGEFQIRAAFKDYDTDPGLPRGSYGRMADKADRYQYDVVAYKLDRMLGLEMVPPAVLRVVQGKEGVLSYWVEDTINERDRRDQDVGYLGECLPSSQYNLMNIFDVLIHNDDRNLTNVLYTRGDWKLWLIDHSRAFRSNRKIPEYLSDAPISLTPQLRAMLELIDEPFLDPLKPYLHSKQIKAIVSRARLLARK